MLESLTVSFIFSVLLIFCRIGACFMVLPGFSELYIPIRSRLFFALSISLVLFPVVKSSLPALPASPMMLFLLLLGEIVVGLFIASITKIITSTMHAVGLIVATQSGLGSAMLFDPNQGAQGAIVGNFLTMIVVTLLFVTDMHYILLRGLGESYSLFPPGEIPDTGDMSELITHTMVKSFDVGIKIAAPQLVLGLLVILAGGILSRVMPALQIFFLMMPIQILISFFLLATTLSAGMMWYLGYYEESLTGFFSGY